MTKTVIAALVVLCVLAMPLGEALAHGGGTNSAGCHTNRKTGDYHCHRAKSPSPGRTTYCHIVSGQHRCGYALSTCRDLVRSFGGHCAKD